jgi:TonB-dependent starch-binding outer membrane protein SusC
MHLTAIHRSVNCTDGLTRKINRVMKITAFLLLAACLQVSARTEGQTVTLHVRNASMKEVFRQIQKQTGLDVLVDEALLQKAGKVTLDVKDMPVPAVLDICLQHEPLSYTIVDDRIVVKAKAEPVVQPGNSRQNLPPPLVKGRILNENGGPVIANIIVKGSQNGTTSDADGYFELKNVDENAILVITAVNIEPIEIKLNGRTDAGSIYTKAKITAGEEIIVSTGYQTSSKERTTGSFNNLDNQIINRRTGPDIVSRLEGITPGLMFNRQTLGSSNGEANISIRGHSTIFANDQPLIIVDNFPYDGDINNINPNDVENITILKDAAAASIWGVRSGNGVIVIATKHGKKNQKLTVEFTTNVTVGETPNVFSSNNFIPSTDYIDLEKKLFSNGYYNTALNTPYTIVSPVVAILARQRSGLITANEANAQIDSLRTIDFRTDLRKYFYQHPERQQYAMNLKGGGINNDYFFSLGFDNNASANVGDGKNRLTINSNYNFYPSKHLQFSAGFNYAQIFLTNNSILEDMRPSLKGSLYPYASFISQDGILLSIPRDYSEGYTDTIGAGKLLDWKYRPLKEKDQQDNRSRLTDNKINLSLKYSFFKHFSLDIKYQFQRSNNLYRNYHSDSSYFTRNIINRWTQIAGTTVTRRIPIGGILEQTSTDMNSQRGRIQVNYNQSWDQINISAIGGAEISQTISESNSRTTYGYSDLNTTFSNIDNVNSYPTLPAGSNVIIPGGIGFKRLIDNYLSYYGTAAVRFFDKYSFSLSARLDKSNLFGVNTNQKMVPLYSTGVLWDVSKEKFYELSFMPALKIGATYGFNANINKSVAAVTTLSRQSNSVYSGLPWAVVSNPGNPELKWERVRMINFGIDFGFKDNVIHGSIEYYLKRGIDLFGDYALPPSTGLQQIRGNTAGTAGSGLDVELISRNIKTKNFKWTTSLLLSYTSDKVTDYKVKATVATYLSQGSGNLGTYVPFEGRSLFGIYSYKWAGLSANGEPQGFLNGKASVDYASIISNTTIDSLIYNGPARPTTFGSFMNTFSYKSWQISFNITYKLNYYFRRPSVAYDGLSSAWNLNSDYLKRWQKPGDESFTYVPAFIYPINSNQQTFYTNAEVLVNKGDHIRLQDIRLSYTFKKESLKWLPFFSAEIYGYIDNVGILWRANHNNIDPDLYTGLSIFDYPSLKGYSIGITVKF